MSELEYYGMTQQQLERIIREHEDNLADGKGTVADAAIYDDASAQLERLRTSAERARKAVEERAPSAVMQAVREMREDSVSGLVVMPDSPNCANGHGPMPYVRGERSLGGLREFRCPRCGFGHKHRGMEAPGPACSCGHGKAP